MAPMPATVVVAAPMPVVAPRFLDVPVDITCGHCKAAIVTKTEYCVGSMVWLICALLIICGCWLGCCLIPFGIDSLKDVEHSCPNCKQKIHRFDRLNGK